MLTLLLITVLSVFFFFFLFLDFSSTLSRNLSLSDFLQGGFAIQLYNVNEIPSKQSKIKKLKRKNAICENIFLIESFI